MTLLKEMDFPSDEFLQIVLNAGNLALKLQNKISIKYKGRINPVTSADKKTEEFLVSKLSHLGSYGFFCEEETYKKISEKMFVIDPIDGTVNYAHKNPFWAVSVALLDKGIPVAAATYAPQMRQFFRAFKGKGSFLNGKRISVSKVKEMKRALITTGFPYYVWEKPARVLRIFRKFLTAAQGIRRPGSATIDMAYVACGIFDGFWEEGLYPWDIAAGSLLVKEAGGKVSDYNGGEIKISPQIPENRTILVSNGHLHEKMLSFTR